MRTAAIFAAAVMLASQTCPADEIIAEDEVYGIEEDMSGDTGYMPGETEGTDTAGLIEDDPADDIPEAEDAFAVEVPDKAQACPEDEHVWGEWETVGEGIRLDAAASCVKCGTRKRISQIAVSSRYVEPSCTVAEEKTWFDENGGEILTVRGRDALGHEEGPYEQETPGSAYVSRCTRCGTVLGAKSYATRVDIPPTCTEPGYIVTETSGTVERTETDPPLGHDWILAESVTEDLSGVRVSRICSRCETSEETVYGIASKNFDCVDGGTVTYLDGNGNERTLTVPVYEDHDWGEWVDVTGDREFGTFCERTCGRCGKKDEKAVGSAIAAMDIPPTCTEPGRKITYTYNNSGKQVIVGNEVTSEPLGHDFSVVKQTFAPDDCAVSGGKTTYGCSRCGETVTVTLPPSGHDWTEWTGTATKTRECRKCHRRENAGQSTASSETGAKPSSGTVSKPAVSAKKQPVTITAKGLKDGKLTLKKGKSRKLKAVLSGVKGKVKWSSSKKKVVTVDKKGKIKAKKKGTAYITAKVGKHKVKIKVVVK